MVKGGFRDVNEAIPSTVSSPVFLLYLVLGECEGAEF